MKVRTGVRYGARPWPSTTRRCPGRSCTGASPTCPPGSPPTPTAATAPPGPASASPSRRPPTSPAASPSSAGPARCPTPSCTATRTSASSTAPATPRSSPTRPPASASRPSPSPTTTASTAWCASPRPPGRSGLPTIFGAELSLGLAAPQHGVADPEGSHLLVLARDPEGYARARPHPQPRRSSRAGRRATRATTSTSWPAPTAGTGWCSPAAARARCPPPSPPRAPPPPGGPSPTSSPSSATTTSPSSCGTTATRWTPPATTPSPSWPTATTPPVVATNNVHYATPARRRLATALAAVRARRSLDELDGWLPAHGAAHLRSGAEQARRFRRYPGAVETAAALGRDCAFDLRLVAPALPPFPCPDGLTEMQFLRRLVDQGGAGRYGPRGAERTPGAWAQLDHELALIEALGFPGYFLVVWDIVRFCREAGIFCQGRGSAANSAVCYALGVTNADAVGLGLLFERFLSPERDGPPDIDLDIESGRREEVIQYVYAKHGRHHAAQVANVITYRAKSSIRDMAKALGYATGQQDAWSKQVDPWSGLRVTAERAGHEHEIPLPVLELAMEVEHFPRHLGIHSGGMVICDRPVIEVCPVEWARMEDRSVLQWDKDDCAAVGLVKFDLLGLGMLSALHGAVDLVAAAHGDRRRPGHDRPGRRRLRHALWGRLGGRVPGRVPGPDVHAAPPQAPLLLRPRGRDRPHPPRPHPGRFGAPLHPAPQRRGARHLPAPPHRGRPGQDPRRAAVPGAAHAARHRRRRVHRRRVRPAPPGHGLEAQPRAHGAAAPPLRRRRRRPGRRPRHRRGALGEARRLRQLRLPREPLGVLRLPRLLVVVAQAVVPRRVLRRAAQRPAHGLLLAAHAGAGRPPPRRAGPHAGPQRLGGGRVARGRHRHGDGRPRRAVGPVGGGGPGGPPRHRLGARHRRRAGRRDRRRPALHLDGRPPPPRARPHPRPPRGPRHRRRLRGVPGAGPPGGAVAGGGGGPVGRPGASPASSRGPRRPRCRAWSPARRRWPTCGPPACHPTGTPPASGATSSPAAAC